MRRKFYEVADNLIAELERRFCQASIQRLISLETIVIDLASGKQHDVVELTARLDIYGSDFDVDILRSQLLLLPALIEANLPKMDIGERLKKKLFLRKARLI